MIVEVDLKEEIIKLLKEMIACSDIGLYSYRNYQGADSYDCPVCLGSKKIDGYAYGKEPLREGVHRGDCNAAKLDKMLWDEDAQAESIIELVEEMINFAEIGVNPVRNNHGADSYMCQACDAHRYISGFAYGQTHLLTVEHEDDCNAIKLYQLLQDRQNQLDSYQQPE